MQPDLSRLYTTYILPITNLGSITIHRSTNQSKMASSETIILTNPEDWEPWLSQVRTFTDEDIWPHVDPDDSEVEDDLLEKPTRPEVRDFDITATSYAELTDARRTAYDNSRKHYESDLRQYQRQKDLIRSVRNHIMNTTSTSKKLLLDPSKSTYQWLLKLKEDTKPSDHFMKTQVEQQYTEALKGLKLSKINQWLDRWEYAMKMARKYNLPHMSNGTWLYDLARAVRPLSETYGVGYNKQARDPEKSDSSEYHKVAMELREEFGNLSKKSGPSGTMRGTTFNVDFGGESEEENPVTEGHQGRGNTSSHSRKRAGTNSIEDETSTKKSKKSKCPACELKGHALLDCWYLFEDKRPEGFKVATARMEKTRKKVEQDKELNAQVEKLKLQRKRESNEA